MRFVFNLEETISFHGEKISAYLTEMLTFLAEQGHEAIIVSSKSIRNMMGLIDKRFHHNKLIGGNGAVICYRGNVEQIIAFSTDTFNQLKTLLSEYDATYFVESDWDYSYTGGSFHHLMNEIDPYKLSENISIDTVPTAWKIIIISASYRKELIEKLKKLNVNYKFIDKGGALEITPMGLSRWSALRTLGIQKRNYIVFGKDEDDLSMFDHAQYTVLVGKNKMLAKYADVKLAIDDLIEPKIVEVCKQLSVKYAIK